MLRKYAAAVVLVAGLVVAGCGGAAQSPVSHASSTAQVSAQAFQAAVTSALPNAKVTQVNATKMPDGQWQVDAKVQVQVTANGQQNLTLFENVAASYLHAVYGLGAKVELTNLEVDSATNLVGNVSTNDQFKPTNFAKVAPTDVEAHAYVWNFNPAVTQ